MIARDTMSSAASPAGPPRERSYQDLRCLVLGGGGFIGTNLTRELVRRHAKVTAFGRSFSHRDAYSGDVVKISGRLSDLDAVTLAIKGQDVVFHVIGGMVPGSQDADSEFREVVNPTLHVLKMTRAGGVRKLILLSSGGTVYGIPDSIPIAETAPTHPICIYGMSKLALEKYFTLESQDAVIFRGANVYGRYQTYSTKGQGLVAAVIERALRGLPIEIWGTGEAVRDFIHVDDIVRALLDGVFYDGSQRIMNVGSGVGRSVNQVIADIERALGKGPIKKIYQPVRQVDVAENVLDISLIRRELRWQPRVAWQDGLRDTAAWLKETIGVST